MSGGKICEEEEDACGGRGGGGGGGGQLLMNIVVGAPPLDGANALCCWFCSTASLPLVPCVACISMKLDEACDIRLEHMPVSARS